jgi:hypothetical protein
MSTFRVLSRRLLPWCAAALVSGGTLYHGLAAPSESPCYLPTGWPTACCAANGPQAGDPVDCSLPPLPITVGSSGVSGLANTAPVVQTLTAALGSQFVLTGADTEPYTTGARLGHGTALAVALPGTLEEAVVVLQACVDAGVAVIPQGRNTGLTGGSVPRDEAGRRPIVILSTRRLDRVASLENGNLLLALGGAGIADAAALAASVGRESHRY